MLNASQNRETQPQDLSASIAVPTRLRSATCSRSLEFASVLDPANKSRDVVVETDLSVRCVVCSTIDFNYAFKIKKNKFFECSNCRTIVPEKIERPSEGTDNESKQMISRDSDSLITLVLDSIKDRSAEGPYLIISTPLETALVEKLKEHLPSTTVVVNPTDLGQQYEDKYSATIVLTPLSTIHNPTHFLHQLRRSLQQDGHVFFLQPMVDSPQSKLMRSKWLEWNQPHQFYLGRDALHTLMISTGFDRVWFRKASYPYPLDYICRRLQASSSGMMSRLMKVGLMLPAFLRNNIVFRLPSSHIMLSCQLAMPALAPVVSIIVPVFNEKNTFEELMQALLEKNIPGMSKQIIIVESNSTDGTRSLVEKYTNNVDVQIIWQTEAKGKGYAVREGLKAATGDYVLIQDADLEYDLNDYDSLLAPLVQKKAMLVLGSRHSGSWKIREFTGAAWLAATFNIGHIFFTWLINLLTRQKMADPFTMFKVFRRDALFGLDFVYNRFDFDHEILIKLIRKGYQPLELPVNYRSRSFAEGKKVSFCKDGITWVYKDLRLRFGRLGKWPG